MDEPTHNRRMAMSDPTIGEEESGAMQSIRLVRMSHRGGNRDEGERALMTSERRGGDRVRMPVIQNSGLDPFVNRYHQACSPTAAPT